MTTNLRNQTVTHTAPASALADKTPRAFLLYTGIWLPKSQIEREYTDEGTVEIRMPRWLAEAKGIEFEADEAENVAPEPRRTMDPSLSPGVYEKDGVAYRVKRTRDGERLYAERLVEIGGTRLTELGEVVNMEFEYDKGAIFSLTEADRMTLERGRALAIRYARCIQCSKDLKAARSVKDGIGPVCRKSFRVTA